MNWNVSILFTFITLSLNMVTSQKVNGAGHRTALPQGIAAFYLFVYEE